MGATPAKTLSLHFSAEVINLAPRSDEREATEDKTKKEYELNSY